ncbi:GxxExxY protein [Cytophagaceae bacterium AH-315-L13]|nr:GxxExxY protein [Cytophagaceae bacterium AH-315-L13]
MKEFDASNYKHSQLTSLIIKEAHHVFGKLGHGFLEKVYENSLYKRLRDTGLFVQKQQPIQVIFEDIKVGDYFADLIVNEAVIVELKAVESLHEMHEVQLVNYLKATEIEVGLLINFGEKLDIKRRVFSNDFLEKKKAKTA